MVKSLRYLFASMLMLVCGSAMAEDIIWQEDFSTFAKDSVPTGGDFSYSCTGTTKVYNEKLAGGTAPELFVQKGGQSFSAVIPLNGKSGSMFLSYKANYDRLTVAVKGATLGEKEVSGNTYTYPIEVNAGTSTITFSFTNSASSNVRLDDIKLYQGTTKKPAGLSWGKASTTVTLGGDYANIPTLQNSNNLSVTCTSTDETVCTVTNDGVITVVGAGKTVITASFEGNDEFEAQTVSIEITVNGTIDPNDKGGQNNPYNIEELVTDFQGGTLKAGTTVFVKGFITNIDEVNVEYGNATFKIATVFNKDAKYKLFVYRTKYLEKSAFTASDQIKEGDEVIVTGKVELYDNNGHQEGRIASGGYIYSHNGVTEQASINTITIDVNDAPVYNLNGQRVMNAQKGLFIIGGKKVIK